MVALPVLGIFFPWAFALFGIGLAYTIAYCVSCASKANLNVLVATEGPPKFSSRLKWRAAIAFLHFLEPLARDWGRLKGGLTPWRSVFRADRSRDRASTWWQRLQPFKRQVRWSIPGSMSLDKYNFLDRLLKRLASRGCAAGWNPTSQDWDLKVRRGALGVAWLRMVVEHHGGPKRLARLSAVIKPPSAVSWTFGVIAALSVLAALLDYHSAAAVLTAAFALLWIAVIAEKDRLEAVSIASAAEVAQELELECANEVEKAD